MVRHGRRRGVDVYGNPAHDVVRWIPLAMLPLMFARLYLISCDCRAPILASASELQAQGNTRAPSRSE
jgi:hypothetical protein